MDLLDRRGLKNAAGEALSQSPGNPKRIILIHTAVSLGIMLLVVVLDFILSKQIDNTVGLSGLGTRSVLTTIQSLLQMVQVAVLPFWEIGYLFAVKKMAIRKPAEPDDLLEGFRHFGPFFRAILLKSLIFVIIGFICTYVATQIFVLTPWAAPMMDAMAPVLSDPTLMESAAGEEALMQAMDQAMDDAMIPLLIITGILMLIAYVPLSYRLRLINYSLLEHPEEGALWAFRRSFRLMRGNCLEFFLLDVSFWWYYLLQLLVNAICYGDLLLSFVGINLPWSEDVSFFLFYIPALAGQFVLYFLARNQVEVTYVTAYHVLSPYQPAQPENQ